MTNKKSLSTILAAVIIITAIIGVLFLSSNNTSPDYSLNINYDHPVSLSATAMSDTADYIVIGKYEKLERTWNMRRDINDITKEATDDYVEGRLYKFTITEVVKGNIEETEILVNHRYLERLSYQANSKATSVNVQDPLYIEPQMGGTYMLFLSKDNNFGNYYGATEPFMVKIENDKAVLQSNLIEKEGDFVTTAKATNGDTVELRIGASSIEDNITGMTVAELKDAIK